MQDLIDDVVVQWRRRWSFWLCFISCFSHLCFVLYPRLVGCIDAKCLTKFQSWLGMLRLSLEGDFWLIIIVIFFAYIRMNKNITYMFMRFTCTIKLNNFREFKINKIKDLYLKSTNRIYCIELHHPAPFFFSFLNFQCHSLHKYNLQARTLHVHPWYLIVWLTAASVLQGKKFWRLRVADSVKSPLRTRSTGVAFHVMQFWCRPVHRLMSIRQL